MKPRNNCRLQIFCFLSGRKNIAAPSQLLRYARYGGFTRGYCRKDQVFAQMKILKVPDFNEIEFGSHFKNNEKYLEICWRSPGILSVRKSGNHEI